METVGAPLLFKCPDCQDEVKPCQVLLTDQHTLCITAFCARCQTPVRFDFAFRWLIEQMCRMFPLSDPKKFTVKDISELHQMGICFLKVES